MRSRRVVFAGSVLFAVAMVAGVVAVVRKRPLQPNVILVVLDTLRADRVGAWNRVRRPTPFLDEFAAASIAYERAYAPGSWTVPTVASLFLAQYPTEHQVVTLNSVLPYDALTLAEVLGQHGYATGGFTANFQVTAENGFGQGFDQYRTLFQVPKVDGSAAQPCRARLGGLREHGVAAVLPVPAVHGAARAVPVPCGHHGRAST